MTVNSKIQVTNTEAPFFTLLQERTHQEEKIALQKWIDMTWIVKNKEGNLQRLNY